MLATVPNSFLAAEVNFKVNSEVEPPAPQVKSVNRGPKAWKTGETVKPSVEALQPLERFYVVQSINS